VNRLTRLDPPADVNGDHETCPQQIRDLAAIDGTQVTVTTGLPETPYAVYLTCPHDTCYTVEPTSDQIAQWRATKEP